MMRLAAPFLFKEVAMSERLTETLRVRITPGLDEALRIEADRLHLRVADVVRSALARAVSDRRSNGRSGQEVSREQRT
jgi:hypothetical protein